MKKLWKYIVAFFVGIIAFFVLWKLRKQDQELLKLRAQVALEKENLKDMEQKLALKENNAEIEELQRDIEEKKALVQRQELELKVQQEEIQSRIQKLQAAQTWEDLNNV